MPRELDALPGVEIGKDVPPGFRQLFFDELDFLLEADAERMFFRVFAQFIQLVLQFDDRLLEIELMFHAWRMLNLMPFQFNAEFAEKRKAGLSSGPRSDEVYTPSPRRSEGRRDQLGDAVRAAPRAKPLCQP